MLVQWIPSDAFDEDVGVDVLQVVVKVCGNIQKDKGSYEEGPQSGRKVVRVSHPPHPDAYLEQTSVQKGSGNGVM